MAKRSPSESRLGALIEQALEERSRRLALEAHPEGKVTIRMSAVDYYWLTKLAEFMDISRTRAAQELLSAAVADAVQAAGLSSEPGRDLEEDIRRFIAQEFPGRATSS
ncbi:hypothetical protein HNR42_002388 [Deinobacterium chartae]|uniref:Uncharacterized protein n=1 Tax=Deinobacterium chartae TaxID=521158 RepID=A0A841I147_9DEIO|nr:hypothetical protein [Deinobacterium chartae]MBB6098953.1 hypothetical protein [Deinobacterium chartae]